MASDNALANSWEKLVLVASLVFFALAVWWGPDGAILFGALVMLAYALWVFLRHPQIRTLG